MLDLEDLQPGKVISVAPLTVTQGEAIAFAKQFDPQPFHTHSVAAQQTPFDELILSGRR